MNTGSGTPAGIKGRQEGVRRTGLHALSLCGDAQVEGVQHHAERLVLLVLSLSIRQVTHDRVAKGTAVYTKLVCPACGVRDGRSG